jgi:hypothetical protein
VLANPSKRRVIAESKKTDKPDDQTLAELLAFDEILEAGHQRLASASIARSSDCATTAKTATPVGI